jgi:hypothetical protein
MYGDALGAETLTVDGCLYYIGYIAATGIPEGCDLINVYT